MNNISLVTQHIRKKLQQANTPDLSRRVLSLVPSLTGENILQDSEGYYWRTYLFIEKAQTHDVIQNTQQAYEAAKAFGQFQGQLADLPASLLNETIPHFHHTRSRYDTLMDAVNKDVCGRVGSVKSELEFARNHESMVDLLLDLQASGDLPVRITHNDTKLNNVMIDEQTSEGICVIDLDTVMPGLTLYDFGDMIRTATNTGAEDELDLSKVSMDLNMFEAITKGYLDTAGDMLSPKEIELLPFSGKLIAFEIGLRFLADYLSGDVYFKTHRDGHNLDRCRTQFKLVESIEQQEDQMQTLIGSL